MFLKNLELSFDGTFRSWKLYLDLYYLHYIHFNFYHSDLYSNQSAYLSQIEMFLF